jgi:hypothetical protein
VDNGSVVVSQQALDEIADLLDKGSGPGSRIRAAHVRREGVFLVCDSIFLNSPAMSIELTLQEQ